jgi:hypothetical protein
MPLKCAGGMWIGDDQGMFDNRCAGLLEWLFYHFSASADLECCLEFSCREDLVSHEPNKKGRPDKIWTTFTQRIYFFNYFNNTIFIVLT